LLQKVKRKQKKPLSIKKLKGSSTGKTRIKLKKPPESGKSSWVILPHGINMMSFRPIMNALRR
jgi:hypothetical protein